MKDNKLIAEFMGVKSYEAFGYTNFVYSEDNHRTEVDLAYHDSWDWLMPVIQKCFDNSEDGDMQYIMHYLMVVDFNNTYKEVVQFINQYNNK